MSVRTVLAVVLAVALCSISYPAIEDARKTRAEHYAEGELTTLENAVIDLEDESAVSLGQPGARQIVALSLPPETATAADIEFVAIGGIPGERNPRRKDVHGDILAYRVEGGDTRVRHVPFDLRVATREPSSNRGRWHIESDRTPLVVRDAKRANVALLLVKRRGKRVVLVTRTTEL